MSSPRFTRGPGRPQARPPGRLGAKPCPMPRSGRGFPCGPAMPGTGRGGPLPLPRCIAGWVSGGIAPRHQDHEFPARLLRPDPDLQKPGPHLGRLGLISHPAHQPGTGIAPGCNGLRQRTCRRNGLRPALPLDRVSRLRDGLNGFLAGPPRLTRQNRHNLSQPALIPIKTRLLGGFSSCALRILCPDQRRSFR